LNSCVDVNSHKTGMRRFGTLVKKFTFGRTIKLSFGLGLLAVLGACSSISFPQGSFQTLPTPAPLDGITPVAGQVIGNGPVQVALLLPLSGDVGSVGISMANAAKLAIDFIDQSPTIGSNITVTIMDTVGNPAVAATKATEAIQGGASLILGPLKAESVRAAGAVARSAGIPLIGFSNNSGAASQGVYLLNILPETEVKRSLAYAQAQGSEAFAAIIPNTDFGQIQTGAFQQATSDLGIPVRAIYRFSNEAEARDVVTQILPFLSSGAIDTIFLPDRGTASSFGILLEEAGLDKDTLTIIGSLDWSGDLQIPQTQFLVGAIYPAVDETGLAALTPDYEAQFGGQPHALSTISYTAVLLANSQSLSQSQPRYSQAQLTRPSGFNGRDGLFRFFGDGRSQYALVIKEVIFGGSQRVDGPAIP